MGALLWILMARHRGRGRIVGSIRSPASARECGWVESVGSHLGDTGWQAFDVERVANTRGYLVVATAGTAAADVGCSGSSR